MIVGSRMLIPKSVFSSAYDQTLLLFTWGKQSGTSKSG